MGSFQKVTDYKIDRFALVFRYSRFIVSRLVFMRQFTPLCLRVSVCHMCAFMCEDAHIFEGYRGTEFELELKS